MVFEEYARTQGELKPTLDPATVYGAILTLGVAVPKIARAGCLPSGSFAGMMPAGSQWI
jgi:hypothetical protein